MAGRDHTRLGAILALALLVRLAGNLYDQGYGFHPDEHHFVDKAITMLRVGTLHPAYFENPPLYTYGVLGALYARYGLQALAGEVADRPAFVAALPRPAAFGLARTLTALAGAATALLLYRIGARVGGPQAGLLAAAIHAVAFLSVRDAHFATNDVPMVTLVTLAFGFALRLRDGGRPRDLVLGGLAAGLATATKYNGAVALLPLGLAVGRGPGTAAQRFRRAGALLLAACAGFGLGNPYALLDPPAFLEGLAAQYELRGQAWRGQAETPVPLLLLQALGVELGWPLLLVAPLAAVLALRRGGARAEATVLALSVVLPLLLYHAAQSLFFARFLLPATPFLALIGAWGLTAAREALPGARQRLVLGAAVALLLVSPLVRSVYLAVLLQRPDTRLLAKAALERVTPVGSVVVHVTGRLTNLVYMPPVDRSDYRILNLKDSPAFLEPDKAPADYYVFSSFASGLESGIEAQRRSLIAALERLGYGHTRFSPLRDGGALPFESDQVYLPYGHLFRYARPGPTLDLYARPGVPAPSPPSR